MRCWTSWGVPLLFLLTASVSALSGFGPTLRVIVLDQDGANLRGRAEVRLSCSPSFFDVASVDALGQVEFALAHPGRCSATVTGPGLVPTNSEEIMVGHGHQARLTIRVRSAARPGQEGPAATVSAARLKVPAKAEKHLRKALELVRRGENAKAEERCRQALTVYPRYADAYNLLGAIAGWQGKLQEAEGFFRQALEADPDHADANANLARIYEDRGDWPEAERLAARSAAVNPRKADPLVLLATAQFAERRYNDVVATTARADALSPLQFPVVHLLSARALSQMHHAVEAIGQYRQFLREAPEDADAPVAREELTKLEGR